MNLDDELGALPYTSTGPAFDMAERVEAKPEDVDDLPALLQVQRVTKIQKEKFQSVTSLSLDPEVLKVFSVEQQLAINREVLLHIQNIQGIIDGAIIKVKEKLNER